RYTDGEDYVYIENFFQYGDTIAFRGILDLPAGQRNPKGFDYRVYLKNRDIYNIMSIGHEDIKLYEILNGGFIRPMEKIALWMDKTINRYVGQGKELLKSMILGQKWDLPTDIRKQFSRTGTAHILAISGLHVGFILAGVNIVLNRFYLRRSSVFIIQTCILIFYCALIGAPASAVRASLMAILYLGAYVLNRPEDRINSLALAFFIILLFRPGQLFDIGFQMSFAAVAGIILLYPRLEDALFFLPTEIGKVLTVIISAQLGVAPLIMYHFNIFSPISIIANLFFVPLAGLALQLGFILFLFALLFPPIANILGWLIGYLLLIFIEGTSILDTLPLSSLTIISPPIFLIIAYYIIIWMLSKERPSIFDPKKISAIVITAVLLLCLVLNLYPRDLKVVFLDVGQGDCIYIETPEGHRILIDAGGTPYRGFEQTFDVGRQIVLPFLLKNGISSLDMVVASHWHEDHVGGIMPIIEELRVSSFLYHPPNEYGSIYENIMKITEDRSISKLIALRGDSYLIGGNLQMDILNPGENMGDLSENNRSIVIYMHYGDATLMFTGDIENEIEEILISKGIPSAQILKIAHHGSKTSSTQGWLDRVNPQIGIVQVGKNSFNLPNEDVLKRIGRRGIQIYRTDRDGAVICRYNKQRGWDIQTMVKYIEKCDKIVP
ncbi:MAG: DNA internalization-related competence protein ComEC/Rec2, partial [Clostridiales bacterium]|nr:DNA internalization-related competence protein ComEC/Rec2 [Clostridiales bacterium]